VQQRGEVDDFFDQVHRHQYPLLNSSLPQINFGQHNPQITTNFVVEDENSIYEEMYSQLIDTTEKMLEILKGNIIIY
jgi:hypothetical protein